MKNTYVKCADWSWEDKLLYIKACIGEDVPHNKICGYVCRSKDDLLSTHKNSADFIYCCESGMISYDESKGSDYVNGKVEIKLSTLKPTPTKFVKVEESIFDLKGEFERGELYSSDCEGCYNQILGEKSLHWAGSQGKIYRQVEIDWRDELDSYLDSICELDSNFDERVTLEFSKSKFAYNLSDDEFVAVCHLVASLTEKPEGV